MDSHTPGPWIANGCIVKARDCYGPWIADTDVMLKYAPNKQHVSHVSHVEQKKNAVLIAASPEMLAVLERVERAALHPQSELHVAVREIIAKAKGELC